MKTRNFFLLIGLCFLGSIEAQDSREIRINFIGGINFAKMEGEVNMSRSSKLFYGLNNRFEIGKKTYLNLDLMHNTRGGKFISPIVKIQYDYIEIPLYIQYEFTPDLRFDIGARIGYLYRARMGVMDGNQNTGIGFSNIEKTEIFNGGYRIGLTSKLQEKVDLFITYDASVSFSHLTLMHKDFRIGFTHTLTYHQKLKSTEILPEN